MGFRSRAIAFVLVFLCFTQTALAAYETFYENSSSSPAIKLLKAAKKSIDIEIYTMNDPSVHQALMAAIDRGVRIRILQDGSPVGAACRVFDAVRVEDSESCRQQKQLVHDLREKGAVYEPFNKAELCGRTTSRCYQHGKLLLIDAKTAMISTGNLDASNLCDRLAGAKTCNRDYSVVSSDPTVVRTLLNLFELDLKGARYLPQTVLDRAGNNKLTVSPDSLAPLVKFIRSAKTTVQIQNQYLNDPELNAVLMEVAARGVKVFVNVTSFCAFARPDERAVAKFTQIYEAFDAVKINTRIFTRKIEINGVSGYLHAKAILVDSERAWVGSVNGSTTSLTNNREFGIFFSDRAEVRKLSHHLYNDYMNLDGETWRESLVCKNDKTPADLPFI